MGERETGEVKGGRRVGRRKREGIREGRREERGGEGEDFKVIRGRKGGIIEFQIEAHLKISSIQKSNDRV